MAMNKIKRPDVIDSWRRRCILAPTELIGVDRPLSKSSLLEYEQIPRDCGLRHTSRQHYRDSEWEKEFGTLTVEGGNTNSSEWVGIWSKLRLFKCNFRKSRTPLPCRSGFWLIGQLWKTKSPSTKNLPERHAEIWLRCFVKTASTQRGSIILINRSLSSRSGNW